jgi:hypothetical protein
LPVLVSVVVVLELEDVLVCDCDCGCSEIELELELFGFVEVEVPALGVWLCGGVALWFWSGVALFTAGLDGFSGVVLLGLATLPEAWPLVLLDDGDVLWAPAAPATPPVADCEPLSAAGLCEDTPEPSEDEGDALHVSAMCFTLATVNVFPADDEDWV